MWNYEKRLQYPVNISKCNLKAAQVIMSQFGGPDYCNIHTILYYIIKVKL